MFVAAANQSGNSDSVDIVAYDDRACLVVSIGAKSKVELCGHAEQAVYNMTK